MMSILGPQKHAALVRAARSVMGVPGAVAECGVYKGGNLRTLAGIFRASEVFGFDTFDGLPVAMWSEGEPHSAGDFGDVSFEAVSMALAGVANVHLVRGIFPDSAAPLSDRRFSFVHLDLDFYASTRAALLWLLPRMSKGGAIVFDDYGWKHCPGVKRAIEEAALPVVETVQFQAIYRVA
ncbi:MAG: class I SAM-dependent methyltransferase [Rhizobiales bacterium]|nr:class I SAM-dependent methyltransferase [Hyphomicrobiales bacterium]